MWQLRDDLRTGPAVHEFPDGRRYEGEFAKGLRNGFGVEWTAQGKVFEAGVWTDDRLTTLLTR